MDQARKRQREKDTHMDRHTLIIPVLLTLTSPLHSYPVERNIPTPASTATPSRALESQLEKSLAWRCSQTLAHQPIGARGRRRDGAESADFGASQLCRGLLEQCDLCADAVRALCTAVSLAAVLGRLKVYKTAGWQPPPLLLS